MSRPGDYRRVVATLLLTDIAFAFQQTAIVPAIPDVRMSLGATRAFSAWLVTVYLIVATVATPALGRLADLYGRRRLLLIGLGVFCAASVGAALAPSMPVLIVFRAIQGVGGAVYPLTLALARRQLPPERFAGAVALFAASFGFGTVLGFGFGGVLGEFASWRYIFVIGAVLVALSAVLVRTALVEGPERAEGRFDLAATLVLLLAASALLMALTLVVELGWASPVIVLLFALVVVASIGWVRVELRRPNPLVDLRVLRTRSVLLANSAAFALGWALFGAYLLLPELERGDLSQAGYGFGADAAVAGALLLPLAGGQLVGSLAASRLARAIGARWVSVAGLVAMTGALAALAGAVDMRLIEHVVTVFGLGLGAGLTLQSSSSVATSDVHGDLAAVSSAVNSTVRRLGGGVGGQVATILVTALTLRGGSQPAPVAFTAAWAVAAGLCVAAATGLSVTADGRGR